MQVIPVNASDLGNRSYVVTDGLRAMAIDPPRPATEVLDIVRSRGLVLEIIVETHLHNDHISGGPELAEATGATYAVCADEHVRGAQGIVDGDRFRVGSMQVDVVATPGHTPHHQSFIVTAGDDCVVFSGGSLLVGTVGRTDLLGSDLAAKLAGDQWVSVRRLLSDLPGTADVHPTHGFGSFCSATSGGGTETTIGTERQHNPAARFDRETFVETLLAGFGEYPSYFAHMAARNRTGPLPPAYRDPVPTLSADDLSDLTGHLWVVDVRPRAAFAAAHVPDTVNVGIDGPLATYIGWTMPWGAPFALVGSDAGELSRARCALAHIGLDLPVGTAIPPAGAQSGRLRRANFAQLAAEWTDDITVIDVRRHEEWDSGHLEGALHVPVHRLPDADLPEGQLWLYCAGGYRAALGASLLQRMGRDVVAVDDTWCAANASQLPLATTVETQSSLLAS
jgi:glyoxylase-like metal-dependent hydrolase (beta-lactamase superfamily II)/rhodanese-related sulfurtransferase